MSFVSHQMFRAMLCDCCEAGGEIDELPCLEVRILSKHIAAEAEVKNNCSMVSVHCLHPAILVL